MEDRLGKDANKNYDWLFIKPEEKARQIHRAIHEIINVNENDPDRVKKALREDIGDGVEYYDDSYMFDLIGFMFSKNNYGFEDDMLDFIGTFENVESARDLGQFIQIKTDDGVIECASISKVIGDRAKNGNDGGDKKELCELCEEIEDMELRQSRCHEYSIQAAKLLRKVFDTTGYVVTGYPHYYVPANKYLHSWVELNINGKDYVLDFTRNAMIDKASFYRLHHIEDKDICSVISFEEIINDDKDFGEFVKVIDEKTYLTTRHEIVRDLDKNRHLFDNSDIDSGEER